jgi:hypothetical protein
MPIAYVNFETGRRGGPGNEQISQLADALNAVMLCAVECLWPRAEYLTCHCLIRFDVKSEASVFSWNAAFSVVTGARPRLTILAIALVKVVIKQTVIDSQSLHRGPSGASVRAPQSTSFNVGKRVHDRRLQGS